MSDRPRTPEELLALESLDAREKLRRLERWETDLLLLDRAGEEGMEKPRQVESTEPDLLRRVKKAILRLREEIGEIAPTGQGRARRSTHRGEQTKGPG